jgi:hypothetical protein
MTASKPKTAVVRMRKHRAKKPPKLWLIPTPPIRAAVYQHCLHTGRSIDDIGSQMFNDHSNFYKMLQRPSMTILTADRILCALDRTDLWHTDPVLSPLYTKEAA